MMQGNSGFLLDAPRDDQRGVYSDELPAYSSPPSNWRDGAKLVMTKVFNFEKGTIVYERAGDAESPAEVEP